MKKTFLIFTVLFFTLLCGNLTAQGKNIKSVEDETLIFYDAVSAYDEKNYGRSLKLCEDAIFCRNNRISKELTTINNAILPQEVQRAGDKLSDVLPVLDKRSEYGAINLIKFYEKKKGEDFFGNSLANVIKYLESMKVYPEAQKLLGDVYKIEGEYEFAEVYYKEALKNASVLDIPDQRYEILYLMAEVSELQNDYNEMETRLLSILSEDKNFTNKALLNAMKRTVRQNKKDSHKNFFDLYRADSYYMMNAYGKLAEYYLEQKDIERALTFSSLQVITGYTRILSVIKKRNLNFENTGLGSVLFEVNLNPDIVQWGTDNGLWKGLNLFANIAAKDDDFLFSTNLLKILAEYNPEEYYKKAAVLILERTLN